jgi:hypothetical protein
MATVMYIFALVIMIHIAIDWCNAEVRSATANLISQCPESSMNMTHRYKHVGPFRRNKRTQCAIECLADEECVALDICTLDMALNVEPVREMCGLRDTQDKDTCSLNDRNPRQENTCQYYELYGREGVSAYLLSSMCSYFVCLYVTVFVLTTALSLLTTLMYTF